jgi:hypothetical protein
MPYIECHIATGLTKARKTQLIRDIVKVTHESIGSDPKGRQHEHFRTNSRRRGSATGRAEGTSLSLGSRKLSTQPGRPEPDGLRMESSYRVMHSASDIAGLVFRHAHPSVSR